MNQHFREGFEKEALIKEPIMALSLLMGGMTTSLAGQGQRDAGRAIAKALKTKFKPELSAIKKRYVPKLEHTFGSVKVVPKGTIIKATQKIKKGLEKKTKAAPIVKSKTEKKVKSRFKIGLKDLNKAQASYGGNSLTYGGKRGLSYNLKVNDNWKVDAGYGTDKAKSLGLFYNTSF